MKPLHHYIVVRRDLPLGVMLAMVAHAAGESFYQKALPKISFSNVTVASGGYTPPAAPGGSCQGDVHVFEVGPSFNPAETIAVVLGARNEGRLTKLAAALTAADTPFVEIRETEGEYAGQLLAIGIVPGEKATLAPFVRDFHMVRELGS